MLYDPHWEQQTKARPLSFASFIKWLEAQHPETAYTILPVAGCLLTQFARAMGARNPTKESCALSKQSKFAAAVFTGPYTFGAALKRARAL